MKKYLIALFGVAVVAALVAGIYLHVKGETRVEGPIQDQMAETVFRIISSER